ncbi:MAG: putative metalloprotease CJM1_0395 family protein [Blastopirellula sp. JB062]
MHVQPLLLSSVNLIGSTQRGGGAQQAAPACQACETDKSKQPADELSLSDAALAASSSETDDLTTEERQQVEQLKRRDQEVRQHEQAHLAAAGPYARGGPTYTYQEGPDEQYAIGGEVQIDTAPVEGDPHATLQKARVIQAAAQAPAEPSAQDQAVAAAAVQLAQSARQELQQQKQTEQGGATSRFDATAQAKPIFSFFAQEAQAAYAQADAQTVGNLFVLA